MIGRSTWTALVVAGSAVVLGAASCSVDNRQLLATSDSAGTASFGNAGAGGRLGAGDGGDSNQPGPLPLCDYSVGVDSGCDTLVDNPGFTKDVYGWTPEDATVTMTWTNNDSASSKKSGSMAVVNALFGEADGTAARGAAQCFATSVGRSYSFGLDMFIPEGQGDGPDGAKYSGNAGLSILFFTDAECAGYTLSSATSGVVDETGSWQHREGRAVTPEGARSMSVRLVTFKNFREYSFEARFDNVLLRAD
ncbi:MAG: hypothetical protein ABW061_05720 [Polyangiaceae bacterium]